MATTEKKNQHYVPKFYLRNFSYQNNGKQIGVYNVNNTIFTPTGKLKTQGSKNFFYGYDGKIEDALADIEGKLASIIRTITETKDLPKRHSTEHCTLLLFTAITDLRNPVKIDGMKEQFEELKRVLLGLDSTADVKKLVPDPCHEHLVQMHIAQSVEMAKIIQDLDYKLFINATSIPFITSNFPVVKYNQFLEMRKWPFGKTGYGLTGLQIFIPLNAEIALVFFDPLIYKVGDRKKNTYTITKTEDVDQLNLLQFLNCLDTIFFNEKANERYIRKLHDQSKKFIKANTTHSNLSYLIKEGDMENKRVIESGQKNLIRLGKTDCEIKLNIDGLSIHSRGKNVQLNDTLAQLRPHAAAFRDKQNY